MIIAGTVSGRVRRGEEESGKSYVPCWCFMVAAVAALRAKAVVETIKAYVGRCSEPIPKPWML
eukprot:2112092-Amphidinium_carterae.1